MATEGNNNYPLTKFYFKVSWEGLEEMSFHEVSGLEMTREKAEYRGGLDKGFTKQQIPGLKKFGELTLKRGTFIDNNEFFEWWNGNDNDPMPERKDLTITLNNAKGDPLTIWKVVKAFPIKVTSTDLNAEKNEIAIETLVLTHEGITVTTNAS